ncbi:MAG: hypothetical protein M1840_008253 [Geoglossum simile]|nr:MAG: hypothetical protein M1840_008253 [Geoglossum simile]
MAENSDVTGSSKSPPPASLNPRSCVTCRRRKVKCDKHSPCSNCTKAHILCVFPERGRAVRRPRKPPDNELLKRLAKLEGVVEELSGQVGVDEGGAATGGQLVKSEGAAVEMESGRLVIDQDRSRYVSSGFWAGLSNEVDDLKAVLYECESDNDASPPSSGFLISGSRDGFIFGYQSLAGSLRDLHPEPNDINILWLIYTRNIDPVLKIVHKPTFERSLVKVKNNLDGLSRGMEAMMFAMYFAAVESLEAEECRLMFHMDKGSLHNKYRFAIEQALARAGFLDTRELIVLQAFVVFLVCARRHTESRKIWTLTGLSIRIAQSLGLHRDGTVFGLCPFEIEMRRRLWWQICILDVRSAEDDGSDPSIIEHSFDTKLPLNINDSDINPQTQKMPMEREECTDMIFCLVRFEICRSLRRLNRVIRFGYDQETQRQELTLKEKEKLLEDCQQMLDKKYISKCDPNEPLHWVSVAIVKLVIARVYLMVHHPSQLLDGGVSMPQETRDRLFETSCTVLEYSNAIQSWPTARHWGWLFKKYVQWHAVSFTLSELCVRVDGPEVDKAWSAVTEIFREADQFEMETDTKRSQFWKPMIKQLTRAKIVREAHVREKMGRMAMAEAPNPPSGEAGDYWSTPGTATSIVTRTLSPETPLSFGMDVTMSALTPNTPGSSGLLMPNGSEAELLSPFMMNNPPALVGWQGWDNTAFQSVLNDQGWSEDPERYTAPSIW